MDATKFNPSAVAGGARALGPISSCNIQIIHCLKWNKCNYQDLQSGIVHGYPADLFCGILCMYCKILGLKCTWHERNQLLCC